MFSHVEILFNLLWFFVIAISVVITVLILKRRDPHDDGPALEDVDE